MAFSCYILGAATASTVSADSDTQSAHAVSVNMAFSC